MLGTRFYNETIKRAVSIFGTLFNDIDVADIKSNPKFKHKLQFMKEMIEFLKNEKFKNRIILGDFNIAPNRNDIGMNEDGIKRWLVWRYIKNVFGRQK